MFKIGTGYSKAWLERRILLKIVSFFWSLAKALSQSNMLPMI